MSENSTPTKSRFRFTEEFDIHLAREVYPYEDPKRWGTIQINMIQITGKCVSIRTLRERVENLVKKYLAKAKSLEGKSGIEILVTELDDILQQIADIMAVFQKKKKCTRDPSVAETKSSYLKGYEAREESCSVTNINYDIVEVPENNSIQVGLKQKDPPIHECVDVQNYVEVQYDKENQTITQKENEDVLNSHPPLINEQSANKIPLAQVNIMTPKRKRNSTSIKQGTVEYLDDKNKRQYDIRCRELALQEKKQLLEEKKYEMDKQERQKRLDIEERRLCLEEKRFKIEIELFDNQEELIKKLFQRQD